MAVRGRNILILLPLALLLLFASPTSAALPPLLTSAVSHTLAYARSFLVLSARVQLTTALFHGLDDAKQCFQPEEQQKSQGQEPLDTTACVVRTLRALTNAYLLQVKLDDWFFGPAKDAKQSVLKRAGRLVSRALVTEWVVRGDFSRITTSLMRLLEFFHGRRLIVAKTYLERNRFAVQNSKWYRWVIGTGRRPIEVDFLLTIARRTGRIAREYAQTASYTIAAAFQPKVRTFRNKGLRSRFLARFADWGQRFKGRCATRRKIEKRKRMRGMNLLSKFVMRLGEALKDAVRESSEDLVWGVSKARGSKLNTWVWWKMSD